MGTSRLATINFDSELRRAGAHSTHGWRRLLFLAQRYLLGTIGLFIMVLFVWMAISADLICRFSPLSVDSAHRLAAPDALHWMGTDSFARVIRANTLALRELPFVEAAKSIGMSETRIALRHELPNTLAPLIVLATAQLGSTILTEASLSFLGLGIPEPYPSWGRMLSESAAEYVRTAPWLVIFPGVAISLAVFGTNLFGDALRDILDPRQRG